MNQTKDIPINATQLQQPLPKPIGIQPLQRAQMLPQLQQPMLQPQIQQPLQRIQPVPTTIPSSIHSPSVSVGVQQPLPCQTYQIQPTQYLSQPLMQRTVYGQTYIQQPTLQQGTSSMTDIQLAIESYFQLYYTDEEIAREMEKKNVPVETTMFILSSLKEQCPEYFKAYGIRLMIKRLK